MVNSVQPSPLAPLLQPVVDAISELHNVSFSIGLRTAQESLTVVSGLDNRATRSRMSGHSKLPMGSVTKSWTAAAIMRLKDQGRIDIDAPISMYVDPVLQRLNRTTVYELWGKDPKVYNVTPRLLMGMRAGLHDYVDSWYRSWVLEHEGTEQYLGPIELLHALNKSWVCDPGTCGSYASPGYELLGLALTGIYNLTSWEQLDQFKATLPVHLQTAPVYASGVSFPGKVSCRDVPDVAHQYDYEVLQVANSTVVKFSDIIGASCLNGWTCGNIAATVESVANYYWDLFHGQIVSKESLSEMTLKQPFNQGWNKGLQYGLGVMQTRLPLLWDPANITWMVGHGGCDYGSIALQSGYNALFNFSMSIAVNSVAPLNCSTAYKQSHPATVGSMYSQTFYMKAVCIAYDEILQALSSGKAPRLSCTSELDQADLRSMSAQFMDLEHSFKMRHSKFLDSNLDTYNPTTSNYSCSFNF